MEFEPNQYFTNAYNPADINSIYEFSKNLIGKNLLQLCHKDIKLVDPDYESNKNVKQRSGIGFGDYLEKFYFGYKSNSKTYADFPLANLELKSAGVKEKQTAYYSVYVKKEPRLTLSTINNEKIVDEEFETSAFLKKNKNLLIIFWLHKPHNLNQHPIEKEVLSTYLFELKDKNYEIIKKDWEYIRNKIRNCQAHDLKNRETVNLESCGGETKPTFYKNFYNQIENCPLPAKNKRFAYTKNFWNSIIDDALN